MIQQDFKKALYNNYVQLVLRVKEVEIDKINNTSTVEWELWLERFTTYAYNYYNTSVASVSFDDEVILNKNVIYDLRNQDWVSFGKGRKVIQHDKNGEKSFTVWFRLTDVAGFGDIGWVSGTVTLTKIDRESQVKRVTVTELGQPVSVEIDRKIETFKHTVWCRVNNSEWFEVGTNVAYAKDFVPPIELAERITASDTGTLDICVRTFTHEGVKIGDDAYSFGNKIKVPENIVPIVGNITAVDIRGKTAEVLPANEFLFNTSNVRITLDGAQGVRGSTITSYKIKFGNQIMYTNSGDFYPQTAGEVEIVGEVTDSRGRTAKTTKIVKVHEYEQPRINVFLPLRDGNGTNKNVKAQTGLKVSSVMVGGRNINEYRIIVEYARKGTTQWKAVYNQLSMLTEFTKTIDLGSVYELSNSYDFRIFVTDKFGFRAWALANLRTSKVLAVFSKNGFHLGELPEESEKEFFTSSLPAKFKNTAHFEKDIYYKSNPIQTYQLTAENGLVKAPPTNNIDEIKTAGFYKLPTVSGLPRSIATGAMLRVTVNEEYNAKTIAQEIISDNLILFRTNKFPTGWNKWKVVADNDDEWRDLDVSSFRNNWQHSTGYGNLQYRRDGDTVYLRGNMQSGSNAYDVISFVLPFGYRPTGRTIYVRALNNDYKDAIFVIYGNGEVRTRANVTPNWINFDNISFKI
jgi:prophage lambdaSa04, minor structural protein|nr:MAG TPA: protein of unknown function DUF859 [Caudoviricetes sp.]